MYNTYLADPAKNVLQRRKKDQGKEGQLFPLWLDAGETPRLPLSCPVPSSALQGLWGIFTLYFPLRSVHPY